MGNFAGGQLNQCPVRLDERVKSMKHKYYRPSHSGQSAAKFIAVALCAVVTVLLLVRVLTTVGRPMGVSSGVKLASADSYRMALSNRMGLALDGVVTTKKSYWIPEDALAAPKPDPMNFGATRDVQELKSVMRRASDLMGGQEFFFDPETEFFKDYPVEYYRDDTIVSFTWKVDIGHSAYTITEVKVGHPSQFRRFLSGGDFGSGKLFTTSEMAQSVNAVVATSADYYNYRPAGITIYKGQLRKNTEGMSDICFIDDKGDLLMERDMKYATNEQILDYIAEHNINFSLAFGPIVIENGELCVPDKYYFGEINENYARAGIAQLGELHYVIMNANDELGAWYWPTVKEFAEVLLTTGCDRAYMLDGGQTATTVVNGRVINHVSYGSERKISDIIYFASAIPDGG